MPLILSVVLASPFRPPRQVIERTRWAVTDFLRRAGSKSDYGPAAAQAVLAAMVVSKAYETVDASVVRRATLAQDLVSPRGGLVNLIHVGQDVGARVVVRGEVIECGVESLRGGHRGWATLEAVAYDVPSAAPCNGAIETGESTIRSHDSTDETLVSEAIRLAAARIVRRIQATAMPKATVLNFEGQMSLINQGTRGGFRTGDKVVVTRGSSTLGLAVVERTEPDQAEIVPQGIPFPISPGDRVWAVFDLPLEPLKWRRTSSRVLDFDPSPRPQGFRPSSPQSDE